MASKPNRSSTNLSEDLEDHEQTRAENASSSTERAPSPSNELDEEEEAYRKIKRDPANVKDAAAAGLVTMNVAKLPPKNSWFRTHEQYRPIIPIVTHEAGIERQFFAVDPCMEKPLEDIAISFDLYTLYWTITSLGVHTIVPVRCDTGNRNDYDLSREIGLTRGIGEWQRLFHDTANRRYEVFQAPAGKLPAKAPFPELKESKIYHLAFRARKRVIDSPEHPLFLRWATGE